MRGTSEHFRQHLFVNRKTILKIRNLVRICNLLDIEVVLALLLQFLVKGPL